MNDIFFEIHKNLPKEAPGSRETTRSVYNLIRTLPKRPLILDIGCGPGMQTIELAKISNGSIYAVDSHQPFLDSLKKKANQHTLNNIYTLNQSMHKLTFKNKKFDLIWSEGAIYIIGFDKGLKYWKKFLKRKGVLAVSEVSWIKKNPPVKLKKFWAENYPSIRNIEQNLEIISKSGYKLMLTYVFPEKDWWNSYYIPLVKRIEKLKIKYSKDINAKKYLKTELKEIELFRKYSKYYNYVFYVMQKR
ncbi:MAG: class I SAM-dependent methyltransferase [Ignavibacteria bacterium]|nr:class I SAM-dependent methyltransferase [Ignavibacteria bacterium]